MVNTRPSRPMTAPWPMRSVPRIEAVKASSGISACTSTTDLSAESRSKLSSSCLGCRRGGKDQWLESESDMCEVRRGGRGLLIVPLSSPFYAPATHT